MQMEEDLLEIDALFGPMVKFRYHAEKFMT